MSVSGLKVVGLEIWFLLQIYKKISCSHRSVHSAIILASCGFDVTPHTFGHRQSRDSQMGNYLES